MLSCLFYTLAYFIIDDRHLRKSNVNVCVCVCVCVHNNSKNNISVHLKHEHNVVYGKNSDEFEIGHCQIKVKVTARL